ncbi:MAG: zinc-ribbon domain-containing protein, partial [Candidatus Micrarchaeia archaeon]
RGFLKPGEQEGEISGLRKIDASALADFVERVISNEIPVESVYTIQQNSASNFVDNSINTVNTVKKGKDKKAKVNTSPKDTASNSGSYIYCNKCGAKNDINANFCSQCGAKLK